MRDRELEVGDLVLDREFWLSGRHSGIVVQAGLGEFGERVLILWDDGNLSVRVNDQECVEVVSEEG